MPGGIGSDPPPFPTALFSVVTHKNSPIWPILTPAREGRPGSWRRRLPRMSPAPAALEELACARRWSASCGRRCGRRGCGPPLPGWTRLGRSRGPMPPRSCLRRAVGGRPGLSLAQLSPNPSGCSDHIAEAASAARVPDLACAAARGDVFTNPVDRARRSASFELRADRRLGLAEAVADLTLARRAFLPDRHSQIGRGEPRARVVEVHDIACDIRAEGIVAAAQSLQRRFGQERLHRASSYGFAGPPSLWALHRRRATRRFRAAIRHGFQ